MKQCKLCGRIFTTSKFTPYQIYCSTQCNQKTYNRTRRRKMNARRRQLARDIIGNRCVLCDIDDPLILCLDHINDDRSKDYIRWKSDNMRAKWIIENPQEARTIFQTLCYNCNNLKKNHRAVYEERLKYGLNN